MDGREAMALSGAGSYYMQRGVSGSGGPGAPSGLHGSPAFRPMPTNPSISVPSNAGGGSVGSAYPVESPTGILQHGVGGANLPTGMPSGDPVRRKRGRPRKYGPDGSVALALSPMSSTPPSSNAGTPSLKRGRGRPPGTGRKQQLASLGDWISGTAGMGFTPHIITIAIGEDISTKIMSFSQQGPRAVCILSANGAVSTVTLRQPASSGGTVTYEGRFEILCLSGSFLLTDNGGSRSRTGGLSVSLSSPDGRVIGGGVGGMLIAASPVQVVVGSFVSGTSKPKNKSITGPDLGVDSDHATGDKSTSSIAHQNLTPTSPMSTWPGSRPDIRNAVHVDIDLTR